MVYCVTSDNRKIIDRRTISPLDTLEYDVNKTKVRLKDLNNKINGIIGDYRNSIIENNIQTPDMGKYNIISQLALVFDIESDNIDNINEEFHSNGKGPEYDEAPSNNVESKSFNKFLGVYVELPGDEKESKVLARVKEQKQDYGGKLIGMSN